MRTMISFQCDTLDEARAVIDAVAAIGKEPHACSKQYMDSKQLLKNTLELVGAKPAGEDLPPRKNVSPGEPSITKIGTATKKIILADLQVGEQLPRQKYDEHLKLLWKRGEVKFDGDEYYV